MNCNFGAFYDDVISPNQISANEYRQKRDNWFNEHAENQSNDESEEDIDFLVILNYILKLKKIC